ncbi:MAG: LacI family DNA-binding transcriptional regulator, partial [Nocardioides sp.]|uniref:LacI family DNA-binding transcriptional regulator n=1 Tax=Nocardioides sp. TaxID=35761 RepID=UPI0039E4A02E
MAEASGVSRATVSFVLNDVAGQTISASTREKVRAVADRLGYRPHGIARALREGSSRIVVLTVPPGFDGHYSASFIAGLDDELSRHDHVLLVWHGEDAETRARVRGTVAPRAVLSFGEPYDEPAGSGLDDAGGGWADGLAAHAAAQLEHLLASGHTRILLALPEGDSALVATRRRFAVEHARRRGLPDLVVASVPAPRPAATAACAAVRAA